MKDTRIPAPSTKLKPGNLRNYQWRAFRFVVKTLCCALFVDMGLGKTVSTLSAIKHLFYAGHMTGPVLVVAPLRVIRGVWRQEAVKWTHTTSLSFSLVHGGAKARMQALGRPAHVYLINPEGVKWLIDYYMRLARGNKERFEKQWPFEMLVVDESTFFKDHNTQRWKALKKALHLFKRRIILTGTPTPNSLLQLWAQFYIVDLGMKLGPTFNSFRDRFFDKQDYMGYSYKLKPEARNYLDRELKPFVLRLEAQDWLEMPPLVVADIRVQLGEAAREMYDRFEKEMFLELEDEDASVEALNAATLTGRCHQIANGAIYAIDNTTAVKEWYPIHDVKIDAAKEYVDELNGQKVLIAFTFKHDLARLRAAFPDAMVIGKNIEQQLIDWKANKHQIALVHPQSAGHGIDGLQVECRHVLFFSIPWSGEHYDQLIARVGPARRSGQAEPTIVHRIVTEDTVDEVIVQALDRKAAGQRELLAALKTYHHDKEH